MSEQLTNTWRDILVLIKEMISADHFREELPILQELYGDEPAKVAIFYAVALVERFVGMAGLSAALLTPPEEVPVALAEVRQILSSLDFKSPYKKLKRSERQYYKPFADLAGETFGQIAEAMEALLTCYVMGDYDPGADPDALIAEALEMAEEDLEQARRQIARAGAIALHGKPLWWRWKEEAYGPAMVWLSIIHLLVLSYTGDGANPLGPPEEARESLTRLVEEMAERVRGLEEKGAEGLEEFLPAEEEGEEIEDLIEQLVELGENPLSEEQVAFCRAHREEIIPELIDLVEDRELWGEDAPGGGYSPIHAIRLLGELRAEEAVPTLIDVIAETDPMDIIHDAAIGALYEIGPAALEPVMTFMRYSRNVEAKTALAEVVDRVGREDEAAFQALLPAWEEATWKQGKALLAYALARTGGERAIPVLQEALEDPELTDTLDYNTVAEALEQLGVEVSYRSFALNQAQGILEDIPTPSQFYAVVETAPKEWRSDPDRIAWGYTLIIRRMAAPLIMAAVLRAPPEEAAARAEQLLEQIDRMTFDAPTDDLPRWARRVYARLTAELGGEIQHYLAGILLPFLHYPLRDVEPEETPDDLIAVARDLPPESEEVRRLFEQASALALQGRPLWSMWPVETDPPLSGWLEGLLELHQLLQEHGLLPLSLPLSVPLEMVEDMLAGREEEEELPPKAEELLGLLFSIRQDVLPPADRGRFRRYRRALVPVLMRIAEDPHYAYAEGPGGGWAAILAVRLLGELKVTQAADSLVSIVIAAPPEAIIHDAALFSLMALGRAAVRPVQMYLRYGRAPQAKAALAEVLGRVGRGDPESFPLLKQTWEAAEWTDGRRMVALAFGDLRDRRAIPLLQEALEDLDADPLDLDYVVWALRTLGVPASHPSPTATRLRTPAPANPRIIYDEADSPQRLRYNVWGEPLCPDCGRPMMVDEEGNIVHPPEPEPAPRRARPKRKKRKRKRGRQ